MIPMLLVLTLLLPLLARAQQDLGNTSAAASGNSTADISLLELKAQFQPVQDDSVLRSGRLGRPLRGEGRGREGSLWSGGAFWVAPIEQLRMLPLHAEGRVDT